MSRQSERLLECMNDLREDTIEEAAGFRPKARKKWVRWGGLAAVLALAVGVAGVTGILPMLPIGMGGSSGGSGAPAEGTSSFMAYEGPVFPLTLREEDPDLTAERNITFDFAPWVKVWCSNEEEAASRDWLTEAEQQSVLERYNERYPGRALYLFRPHSGEGCLCADQHLVRRQNGVRPVPLCRHHR